MPSPSLTAKIPLGYSKNEFGIESNEYIRVVNCGNLRVSEDSSIHRPLGRRDYLLIYNISGRCHITVNNKILVAEQGDIVLFRPGEPQNYSFFKEETPHNYWVHFSGTACKELFEKGNLESLHIIKVPQTAEIEYYLGKLCNHYHLNRFSNETICSGLMLAVLGLVSQYITLDDHPEIKGVNNKTEQLVSEVISRIKQNHMLWMNVSDCAKYCNLSQVHFARVFKEFTGMPPQQYITKIRIDRAKELLLYSDLSIADIAERVGYKDQNYFSRIFKKEVGKLPSKYRKQ